MTFATCAARQEKEETELINAFRAMSREAQIILMKIAVDCKEEKKRSHLILVIDD